MVIKKLIKDMALRENNVLFIDDNDSNLNEALHYCPEISCISASCCDDILDNVNLQGKKDLQLSRLKQYKQLEQRTIESESYSNNEEFLMNCNIQVQIVDYSPDLFDRAYELVDRTNQLNYTKKKTVSN